MPLRNSRFNKMTYTYVLRRFVDKSGVRSSSPPFALLKFLSLCKNNDQPVEAVIENISVGGLGFDFRVG